METVINIETCGDFDVVYTDSTWISEQKYDVKELVKRFCIENNICSTEGLPYGEVYDKIDDFKKFLKKNLFKELKCKTVIFCN